jgi:hypothetical protein
MALPNIGVSIMAVGIATNSTVPIAPATAAAHFLLFHSIIACKQLGISPLQFDKPIK